MKSIFLMWGAATSIVMMFLFLNPIIYEKQLNVTQHGMVLDAQACKSDERECDLRARLYDIAAGMGVVANWMLPQSLNYVELERFDIERGIQGRFYSIASQRGQEGLILAISVDGEIDPGLTLGFYPAAMVDYLMHGIKRSSIESQRRMSRQSNLMIERADMIDLYLRSLVAPSSS